MESLGQVSRIVRLGVLAMGIVAVASAAVLADGYYQTFGIYQEAKDVLPPLATAADELAQGRLPGEGALETASANIAAARRRMDDARITFRLAGLIPYFGRPVRAIQHGVAAGENEARAAVLMRDLVRDVLGPEPSGSEDPPLYRKGRVDLGLIARTVPRLRAAADHVRRADAEIRAIPSLPFLGFLDRLKADAIEASGQAVRMSEEALSGSKLIPSLLGGQGQRTYLLVLQDGSRLRPTGGVAVAYGFVRVGNGKLRPVEGGGGAMGGGDAPVAPVLPESMAWLLEDVPGLRSALGAPDVNLSPDLPVSAQAWSALAEAGTGRHTDGAVVLDTVALSYLLEGREIDVASHPRPVTGRNVSKVIGGSHSLGSPGRAALAGEVLEAAWNVLSNPDPLVPTLKQAGRALREKHLQIWSAAPADGPHLDALGWDGGLDLGPSDHLLVSQTNMLANGLDLYAHIEIEYDVTVLATGQLRSTCLIRLRNASPGRLPASVAGSGDGAGQNRALLALYVPGEATLNRAEPAEGPPANRDGGANVFLRTLAVPTGEAKEAVFEYTAPDGVRTTESGRVYRLTVQRQASVNPAVVTIRVTLPPGAEVRSAPGWTIEGNEAMLRVTLVRDLVTQIEF